MNAHILPHSRIWRANHAGNPINGYPHLWGLPLGLSLAIHLLVLALWLNDLPPQQVSLAFADTELAIHLQNSPVKTAAKASHAKINHASTNCRGLNCSLARAEQNPTKRFLAIRDRESDPTGLKITTGAVFRPVKIKHARKIIIKSKTTLTPAKIKSAETEGAKKISVTAPRPFHSTAYKQARKPVSRISLSRVISRLQQDLKQYFYYPRLARRENIQGAVILGFAINLQGEIKNIHLVKSSGFAVLDNAAEDALRQLDQLNWGQDYLQRNNKHIELPVIYKLTES